MLKIWRIELDDPVHCQPARLGWLDIQETRRWQNLRRESHRYAAAHTAMRDLLSRQLGCQPQSVQYLYNPWGKPFLSHGPAFSLSHSGGVALLAVQTEGPLGVDIEIPVTETDPGWLTDCQSQAEQSRMSAPLTPDQALRLWVRKEAVLKALGRGLSLPMSQIAVQPGPGTRLRAVSECDSQRALWHLYDLDAGPGAQAALACRCRQESLQIKPWL